MSPGTHPPDAPLIDFLEPDQLVADTSRPVPRRHLGRAASVGLWGLRILFLVMSALVVYTFVESLG
jgi:hypothetical protein